MRSFISVLAFVIFGFLSVNAQHFEYEYHIIYGDRYGSTIDVSLDSDILIQVWAGTPDSARWDEDCECPGFEPDSINFMHNPLATDNSIIVSRSGGQFYYPLTDWDDASFLPPDSASPISGYTSQSILAFCQLSGEPNPPFGIDCDTILIAEFVMHTTSDSAYLNQMVCPFEEGYNPACGGLLWGGVYDPGPMIPIQTFSCLYFVDYVAGDANGSGNVDGFDVTFLAAYLKGDGPAPDENLAGDANGDCNTDLADISYLINYCKGGPAPLLGNCHLKEK